MQKQSTLRKTVFSALCLAVGLVIKQFSIMLPLMGAGGLRISFSGIPVVIPAMLFGPWYGAAVYFCSDIIGYILKPEGDWIPWLTLTAAFGGFLRGLFWRFIRNTDNKKLAGGLTALFAAVLAIGAVNQISYSFFPETSLTEFLFNLKSKGQSQMYFATLIPILAGAVGLIIITINFIISKRDISGEKNNFIKYSVMLLSVGVIITTINTPILMAFYGMKKAFILFYIPRIAEEVIVTTVNAYVLSLIMPRLNKLI